jgi:hypothetical protein
MVSTFNYRLVKASWAIAIDLTADSTCLAVAPSNAVKIKDRLWLRIELSWLSKEEKNYLGLGLSLVAESVLHHKPDSEHILVRVLDVHFNPCHYQPEGLAAAIRNWAGQEFGFGVAEIPVVVDRDRK